jgi:predicted transposase YdaD
MIAPTYAEVKELAERLYAAWVQGNPGESWTTIAALYVLERYELRSTEQRVIDGVTETCEAHRESSRRQVERAEAQVATLTAELERYRCEFGAELAALDERRKAAADELAAELAKPVTP